MYDTLRLLLPNLVEPTMLDGVLAITIIGVTFFIQRLLIPKIVRFNVDFLEKKNEFFFARVIEQFMPSIRSLVLVTAIFIGLSVLLEVPIITAPKTSPLYVSIAVYYAFKGVYDILSYYTYHPEKFSMAGKDQNILTPFFLRIMKVIVMVIALFTIAAMWDFNLNGFLTGIGLTGVAMAFGVRETLGHIFGGMSIALDKPFQIGDWVATEDQKIDGTIADINLRSTLIQTGDKGLVYVPNAYLVNRPIYNFSKRDKRKCEFYQYVATTNEESKLRELCERLHEQIYLHPQTEKDIIHVAIDELYPHAYRMLIRFYVASGDTAQMLAAKQDILFALRQLFDEVGIALVDGRDQLWLYEQGK